MAVPFQVFILEADDTVLSCSQASKRVHGTGKSQAHQNSSLQINLPTKIDRAIKKIISGK